jgi:hypothetical protein
VKIAQSTLKVMSWTVCWNLATYHQNLPHFSYWLPFYCFFFKEFEEVIVEPRCSLFSVPNNTKILRTISIQRKMMETFYKMFDCWEERGLNRRYRSFPALEDGFFLSALKKFPFFYSFIWRLERCGRGGGGCRQFSPETFNDVRPRRQ